MKKTVVKIAIYTIVYFVFVFLINAIFIRPNIIEYYGEEPSSFIFQQTFIGVFVPISFLLPAFFIMFVQVCKKNTGRILTLSICYLILTLTSFILFATPSFSILSILTFLLILASFMLLIYALDYLLSTIKFASYWRWLFVIVIVFAMITSVLWMNPMLETSTTTKSISLEKLVDIAVTVNPAIITIEKVFRITIFRSGNFYSHTGGEGLSMIGDYFGSVNYINPTIVYPLIYLSISLVFFLPAFIIRKFRSNKKQT